MRRISRHQATNLLVTVIGGSLLVAVAVLGGGIASALALLAGVGVLLLEGSARRGATSDEAAVARAVGADVTSLPARRTTAIKPVVAARTPRTADVYDLAAHRASAGHRTEAVELPEGHLAPVVHLDFRRAAAPALRRHG